MKMVVNSGEPTRDLVERADVAVVGTGAGGAVFAAELTDAGRDVVLLEEGGYVDPERYNGDPYEMTLLLYRAAGLTATLGTPGIPLPLGQTVGGTTVINSGTCFRTPPARLDAWHRAGLRGRGLDEAGLDPHFAAVEERLGVAPVPEEHLGHNAKIFRRGAATLGFEGRPLLRNARGCRGTGLCAFGCPRNAKQTMLLTYLPHAVSRGARIYQRARVVEVLRENGRASGVRAQLLDGVGRATRHQITVLAPVVGVAAGAIHSPGLLARSRIGTASGALGKFLSIHPAAKAFAEMDETIDPMGVPQGWYLDAWADRGIMFEGIFVPPELGGLAFPGVGAVHADNMVRYRNFASFGVFVSDTSTGTVRSVGGEAIMTYSLAPRDAVGFRDGLALIAEIFLAAGARKVMPGIHGFPELRSMDDVKKLRRADLSPSDVELMAFHPMGTARMGNDPRLSVVDTDLQAHDLPGCYVVDASVFPSSLGVNPQMSIFAFARRAAHHVVENTTQQKVASPRRAVTIAP